MATTSQLAQYCAQHFPHTKPVITQGYTFMELLISNAVTAAFAGGLAWYIRGRGLTGVQIDISNIKNDIEALKAKVSPVAPAPVVAA